MAKGTVKWFDAAKGFGYITPDDGGKDVYLPQGEIQMSGDRWIKPGQAVEFETTAGETGLAARRIFAI